MNDPEIIEWLESEEGNKWRVKNLSMKNLLLLHLKEDCVYEDGYVPAVPQDGKVAVLGYVPDEGSFEEYYGTEDVRGRYGLSIE